MTYTNIPMWVKRSGIIVFLDYPWNHLTGSDGFASLHETYQTCCNDCWFNSPLEINCFAASIFREPFTLILYKIVNFVLFAINSTDCSYFNLSFYINNVQDNHIDIFIGKSMNSVRKWRSPLNHRWLFDQTRHFLPVGKAQLCEYWQLSKTNIPDY